MFARNIKETTLARYFIKITARPSFTRLIVIRRINRAHYKYENRKYVTKIRLCLLLILTSLVLGIFKIALRLRDRHVFIWHSVEILNDFNTLTLKQIFWKTKMFFKKLDSVPFLVEITNIENASFPFKTAMSEANVKANRMMSTKWTYHKKQSFASNRFIFSKILFQFKNLL